MTAQEVRARLTELAEPAYRDFSSRLVPGCGEMLGVRLPALRKLAAELAAGDWRDFLLNAADDFFEERMLQGMVIGAAKGVPLQERFDRIAWFVPKIDNWSVCDSFCAGLTFARTEPEPVWRFLEPYAASAKPFENRFAAVMMLDWFSKRQEYVQPAFERLSAMTSPELYAQLAVAWAVSVFFVHFPEETEAYLRRCPDDFTRRKAVQKICESRRVSPETKARLRLQFGRCAASGKKNSP